VARQRPLPSSRAVVGGLLVAAAGIGTFAAVAGADDAPGTRYVAAAADLVPGHVVEGGDLTLVAIELPDREADRAFADPDLVIGQVVVAPLVAGDLVQRSAVVAPEGAEPARQVSFAIDPADALAGTLEDGEVVDRLVTYGTEQDAVTEVVVAGAVVARVPEVDDLSGGRTVVLLSLPADADVLAVTSAIRRGDHTIVRTTGAGATPLTAGERFRPGAGSTTSASAGSESGG
jgi:hypothetical protein